MEMSSIQCQERKETQKENTKSIQQWVDLLCDLNLCYSQTKQICKYWRTSTQSNTQSNTITIKISPRLHSYYYNINVYTEHGMTQKHKSCQLYIKMKVLSFLFLLHKHILFAIILQHCFVKSIVDWLCNWGKSKNTCVYQN